MDRLHQMIAALRAALRRLRQRVPVVALALLGLSCLPAIAQAPATAGARGLPSLGDAGEMTPLEERKMGDAIARELFRDPDYIDDPIIGEYVDGIWRALLAGARARGELPAELDERFSWRVLLGRDRSINAFALPGGYFGLLLGLIGVVTSRDELAAVLAHEMSHITQRHVARVLGQQSRQTPLLMAALIAGAIAASKNPQAGAAIAVGGQAALIQQQLNFSRDMEREADRVGFGIMTQAGFSPQGAVGMFEKLQAAARIDDNGEWPYLRSHPLTTERIADMQQRQRALAQSGNATARGQSEPTPGRPKSASTPSGGSATGEAVERGGSQSEPAPGRPKSASAPSGGSAAGAAAQRGGSHDDFEALLIAARARVLSRPGVDVLRAWADEPEQAGFGSQPLARRAPALYAAALAQAQLRNPARARVLADALMPLVAGDARAARQLRLLQAELALQAGDPAGALQWLPEPASSASASRATLLLRAQAQTTSGQARQAASALQAWVGEHPLDAGAWQALALAEDALGEPLRALRASGEVAMAQLDYAGAVDRWRSAQDQVRQHAASAADMIDVSIIDARLRAAQALVRQQREDESKWR